MKTSDFKYYDCIWPLFPSYRFYLFLKYLYCVILQIAYYNCTDTSIVLPQICSLQIAQIASIIVCNSFKRYRDHLYREKLRKSQVLISWRKFSNCILHQRLKYSRFVLSRLSSLSFYKKQHCVNL